MLQTSAITFLLLCSHCLVHCLDTNGIRTRSSQKSTNAVQQVRVHGESGDKLTGVKVHEPQNTRRRTGPSSNDDMPCSSPDCTGQTQPKDMCNNRSQKKSPTLKEDRNRLRPSASTEDGNNTRASVRATCVRSSDCEDGLCCVRIGKVKRCRRIPLEGEMCLLQGRSKRRRNLERCDCGQGLTCSGDVNKPKGQGVCQPGRGHSQRKARHSEKRKRAERICQQEES